MRELRILHLLSSSGFHGAETMVVELVRQCAALGVQCHVGVFDNAGRGDRQVLTALRGHAEGWVVPCRGQFDRAAVAAISEYVARQGIDVVHSHKYKTTFHALLARRRRGFRLLATYHNWLNDTWSLALYSAIDKRLARWCDANVGVSAAVANELRRFAPSEQVFHIENGVDTDRYRPTGSREEAKRALALGSHAVLGFVGRLSAQKGVADLIDAVALLKSVTELDVLIAGDGEHRSALEQHAKRAGVAGNFRFLGTRQDTPAIYSAMDLFVLPSFVEAFPMVLLEAMACEVPVIGTDVGDIGKIIARGETGWVVPAGQPAVLSQTIAYAVAHPHELRLMGARARQTVVNEYSARRMAQRYLERYAALVEAP